MGVNIFNLIINVYISTVIVAVIAFVLNFRRLDRYYRKRGLQAVFNEDSFKMLYTNIKYFLWDIILEWSNVDR